MTAKETLEKFVSGHSQFVTLDREQACELLGHGTPAFVRDQDAYQAFVWFLYSLSRAGTMADVVVAASSLLQDLGEEPS